MHNATQKAILEILNKAPDSLRALEIVHLLAQLPEPILTTDNAVVGAIRLLNKEDDPATQIEAVSYRRTGEREKGGQSGYRLVERSRVMGWLKKY